MPIEMSRFELPGRADNPGLEFDRFMPPWEEDATKRGETFSKFLDRISSHSVSDIYKQAFARWQHVLMQTNQKAIWFGDIQGRLFTGLGMPHPLETQVARNRLYGMPMLPGSGLKGLARAWASQYTDLDAGAIAVLFGRGGDDESGESGYLVFHDAWWVPDSHHNPFVKEVVTVHHSDYYSQAGGADATDFDSPNPSFQLAVRGGFLFAIEGARVWADLAMEILQKGLEEEGFGGKISSGYGFFKTSEKHFSRFEMDQKRFIADQKKQVEEEQKQKKAKAAKSNLSGMGAEFYDEAIEGNWIADNDAFSSAGRIEHWLDRLEETPDPDVILQLKYLIDSHFKGLLANPDKEKGKKKAPAYNDRKRKMARRLIPLRSNVQEETNAGKGWLHCAIVSDSLYSW